MNLAEMIAMANSATEGVEIKGGFEPVPAGTYEVVVSGAKGPKASRRANPTNPNEFGQLIEIEFSIVGGQYAGRKVFANNNIIVYPKAMDENSVRSAQTAMAIGARERKILLESIGKTSIEVAEELVGASCKVDVTVQQGMNGNPRNEVKRISAKAGSLGNNAPATTVNSSVAAAPSVPSKPKMPWEK